MLRRVWEYSEERARGKHGDDVQRDEPVCADPGVTVSYDANGKLLTDNFNSYTWDFEQSCTFLHLCI